MKSTIYVDSNINIQDLSPGDHIFSADFVSDDGGDRLEVKEFEFVKALQNNDTQLAMELNMNEDSSPAEIFDIRFPKIHSKADLSHGFFKTKEAAAGAFLEMITNIYESVKTSYNKFVNL
jgi:hypothetical protein